MASTAAEFADLLEPKLSNIWHDSFEPQASVWEQVFNVRDMNKNTITDHELAGFGGLQNQDDGSQIIFDDPISGRDQTYTYAVRGLAYRVHERLWMNDLYGEVERFEADLMDSARDDVEQAAADVFNNAFTTTNTGFDSLQLCSTAHTRMDGGTNQANRPATDEALSVSAIHNAIVTISKWKNHRGRPRKHMLKYLVVPPDLQVTAYEILDSEMQPETANNTKNVIKSRYGLSPLIWHYLTSTTSWFVTCEQHDVNFLWRFRPQTGMRTEWETESIDRKVRQAYVVGFGQWLGVYGTDGVA